jgi:SAM-dependent methyltransferase
MQLEHVACPCCGADEPRPWGSESGYTAVKCQACGLVYVTPRPSLETISSANRIGEHRVAGGKVVVRAHRDEASVRKAAAKVRTLFGDLSGPVDWLDVGAGYGEFVEGAAAALPAGSRVSGIEPMIAKTRAARERGLAITDTPIEKVEGQFDVVSLINVFSHIPDFEAFGTEIRRLLRPGGYLLLETGNAADLPSRADYPDILYLPDHLVFAGGSQIERILGRLGFAIEGRTEERLDDLAFVVKRAIKGALKGRVVVGLPNRSPFRLVSYRARLSG